MEAKSAGIQNCRKQKVFIEEANKRQSCNLVK